MIMLRPYSVLLILPLKENGLLNILNYLKLTMFLIKQQPNLIFK